MKNNKNINISKMSSLLRKIVVNKLEIVVEVLKEQSSFSMDKVPLKGENKEEILAFPTLYKTDKLNRLAWWRIFVIEDTYHRQSGIEGGKVKEYIGVKCISKNVGRSNQTTPENQAVFEAFSEWKKKIKELYSENAPENIKNDNVDKNVNQENLRPMLAQKFEERKKYIQYPCAVSPKLDGIRVLIFKRNLSIKILSRQGKLYNFLDGIREEASLIFDEYPDFVLDGELYSHNIPFNIISGIARSQKTISKYDDKIEFHIFDIFSLTNISLTYLERMNILRKMKDLYKGLFEFDRLRFVFYELVDNEKEILEKHNEYVSQGYEGVIIRNLNGQYALNKRSNDLQKFKDFVDEEFRIVDVLEGVGSEKGASIFKVITKYNEPFTVRPRGTMEFRREQFKNKNKYIGKFLTVRYQAGGLDMDKNLPRFPVGIDVRDYE